MPIQPRAGRLLAWAGLLGLLLVVAAPLTAQTEPKTTKTAAPVSGAMPAKSAAEQFEAKTPLPAYAPPTVGHYGPSGAWLMVRTIFALGLVVGLIYLTAWVSRVKGGISAVPSGYRLRMVETIALGTNRSLHLVAVGRQILLLGAGSDGLRTLATFTAEELGYDPDAEVPPAESFMAKLQAFRAGGALGDGTDGPAR